MKHSSLAVIATGFIISGCTHTIETPFAEPLSFDATAYCTIDRSAPLAVPEDITAAFEDDGANEETVANAVLVKAAMEIAHAAPDEATCGETFAQGDANFRKALEKARSHIARDGGFDPADEPEILAVQTDITRLWREDQSGRLALIRSTTKDRTGADWWTQRRAVAHSTRIDADATRVIGDYADRYGWIDTKRFGGGVSAHAWILVQHADDHPEFQAEILEKMKPYVDRGETSKSNYAFLWDRVAVNTGQLQRYGTQPTWECDDDGKMSLRPLEDPDGVNARRAQMGLGSVEDGLAAMEADVCR